MAKQEDRDENKFLTNQLKIYDLQLEKQPEDANTYYLKALTLIKLNKKNEALNCLDQAIDLNPRMAIYYAYKAWLHFEEENYQQAEKTIQQADDLKLSDNIHDKNAKNLMLEVKEKIQHYHNSLVYKKQVELEGRIIILEKEIEKLQVMIDELIILVTAPTSAEDNVVKLIETST